MRQAAVVAGTGRVEGGAGEEICLRRRVIATARRVAEFGLIGGTVGNVSARLGDMLLITPTRSHCELLRAAHLA